ncbi:MAG: hypothetical protein ACK5L3_12895 [Oscillospiraceae bacterium]
MALRTELTEEERNWLQQDLDLQINFEVGATHQGCCGKHGGGCGGCGCQHHANGHAHGLEAPLNGGNNKP